MAVYFIALIAGLYTLSTWWSWLRPNYRSVARISRYGADRSFAVFLIHPIMLELLMPLAPHLNRRLGAGWGTAALFVGVLAVTLAIVEIIRHAPGSIWLTGRARIEGPTALRRWARSIQLPSRSADRPREHSPNLAEPDRA